MGGDYYTEPEAAVFLGVASGTLRRYRMLGLVGFHRSPGGRIFYSLDQITEFRQRWRVEPVSN